MPIESVSQKIVDRAAAAQRAAQWRAEGREIVFTNGCFDILHYGHIHYLADARALGDKLIVGLNSGDSVRRLKGEKRPINDENTRSHLLAALEMVDLVVIFDEDTPLELILAVKPDLLVKGGDWRPDQIVGAAEAVVWGGKAKSLPFIPGYSTTAIEEKIVRSHAT